MHAARSHLAPGTMLTPSLRLERELGRGAMGVVWIARNIHLGTAVAVKVLRGAEGHDAHARFVQEARGLSQIDSPHVVRLFDFGVTAGGEPFIVMELLEGEDLRAHIERKGPLGLAETASIVRQIGHALAAAHARGIIHRDIKPANVFITHGAGELFVKVLDFGVAKFTGAGLDMTASGVLVGTPYYASPEQLLAPRTIDHRSDLWSVGVVTYACLTGSLPFQADTLGALSVAIHGAVFTPPSALRPELPPALDAWMRRALARDPAARFSSAREQAEALADAGRALQATYAAAPATVVMEAMSPALSQSTLSPMSATEIPRVVAPAPRRASWLAAVVAVAAVACVAAALLTFALTSRPVAPATSAPLETSAPVAPPLEAPPTPAPSPPPPAVTPSASVSAPAASSSAPVAMRPPPRLAPPTPVPVPAPAPAPAPSPNGNNNPFQTRR